MLSKTNTKTVTFLELNLLIETFENFPAKIKFSTAYEKLTHVSQKQTKNNKTAVSKNTPNFNANTLLIHEVQKSEELQRFNNRSEYCFNMKIQEKNVKKQNTYQNKNYISTIK